MKTFKNNIRENSNLKKRLENKCPEYEKLENAYKLK